MKIRVEKYIDCMDFWAIIRDNLFYLSPWERRGRRFRFEFIDNEVAIKKFKANIDHKVFLFKNEEDARAFLEYIEPIIIMEELTR